MSESLYSAFSKQKVEMIHCLVFPNYCDVMLHFVEKLAISWVLKEKSLEL